MKRFALGAILFANARGDAAPDVDRPDTASCATSLFYADEDGDGFGDPAREIERCEFPAGYSTVAPRRSLRRS